MLRLTILVTGIISFLHFVFPQSFTVVKKGSDVLGITSIEATINKQTVDTALQIYCINHSVLPDRLNDLYGNELDPKSYLDLDKTFSFEKKSDCDFTLTSRSKTN